MKFLLVLSVFDNGLPAFWVFDTSITGIHYVLKYPHPALLLHHQRWAKQKISSLILILSQNCVIFAFYQWVCLSSILYIMLFFGLIWIITPYDKRKVQSKKPKLSPRPIFDTCINSVCVQTQCSRMLDNCNKQLPNCWTRNPSIDHLKKNGKVLARMKKCSCWHTRVDHAHWLAEWLIVDVTCLYVSSSLTFLKIITILGRLIIMHVENMNLMLSNLWHFPKMM